MLMVQFDPVVYSVTEGERASIRAVLNFAADRDVTVEFTTVSGSAGGKNSSSKLKFHYSHSFVLHHRWL